jgi:pimeloyl-ACP methyl ester carboxylesterase
VRGLGDIPSLFVAARNDVLVPVAQVEALARRAGPSASVRIVDSSHLETPDRSRGVVLEWLERLGGKAVPAEGGY